MAEAIVSVVLERLIKVAGLQIRHEVNLVVGVDDEVRRLTSNFEIIKSVLADAEEKQVTEAAVRNWLENLKEVSYDMDRVLDKWNTAIMRRLPTEGAESVHTLKSKVCSSFLFPCSVLKQVVLSHALASKIKAINANLDAIAKEKDRYDFKITTSIEQPRRMTSTFFVDESMVFGLDEQTKALVSQLLCESSERKNSLHIISIVGMGGIGKTTLAQLAYNNYEVMSNFEKRIWVCVSDPFDELRIAKAINEALGGDNSKLLELESVFEEIQKSILEKKFLLVLDDVWTEDSNKWEPFHNCLRNCSHGSKVLVTTRNQRTADMMKSIKTISIEGLSEEHCWSLFRQLAFFGRSDEECEKLEGIGREIVSKCKGLPLATKTMGSLLRFKRTRNEWENILYSEMWKLYEIEKDVFNPLLLSYYDLPSWVKHCFIYCAMFPKDFNFEKDELIKLWMAQGYLGLEHEEKPEIIGEEYFNSLAMHSFFQKFEKDDDGNILRCKMHDIVHDLAQYLSKNGCCMIEVKDFREPYIDALCEKANQLMLKVSEIDTVPIFICNFKKLQSLLIHCDGYRDNNSIDEVLPNLFDGLLDLRVLRISGGHIKHIPEKIGQLVQLRYLDLSNNDKLRKLPETLCELYNLQTLKLDWCVNLEELPQGIGKLINLRYLMNCGTRSLMYIPKGIERLHCRHLQTLSEFHWSGGYGGKACSLKYLNKYWQLAPLHIKGLGDATKVINQIAGLKIFKNIRDLSLVFGMTDLTNDEMILAALHPPPNLEVLTISNYPGGMVSTLRIPLLTSVRWINLRGCIKCLHLPPLGKLSSLEKLVIEGMDSVEEVRNEFLGVESGHTSSVKYFPKLKTLRYSCMLEWEVWDFGIEDHTRIMPLLCSLEIHDCQKLKGVPKQILQKATLENLLIEDCPILERLYEEGTGENCHDISHIPNILIRR